MVQAGATDGTNEVSFRGPSDPQRRVRVNTSLCTTQVGAQQGRRQWLLCAVLLLPVQTAGPLPDRPAAGSRRRAVRAGRRHGGSPGRSRVSAKSFGLERICAGSGAVASREDRDRGTAAVHAIPAAETAESIRPCRVATRRDQLLVNAGAMIEHNNLTGTDVAPQIAANYRVAPDHTMRFSLSRALRTPTVLESQSAFGAGPPGTPRFGPSDELRPETIVSREIELCRRVALLARDARPQIIL